MAKQYKHLPLTREQQVLIEEYLSDGGKRCKQAIAVQVRRKLSSAEWDDYIENAYFALIKAARNYKSYKGTKFSTYASMNIRTATVSRIRHENTYQYIFDKLTRSLDEPISETENMFLKDIIDGYEDVTLEVYKESERIMRYLQKLSEKEKQVLYLRQQGKSYMEIRNKLGYNVKQMKDILMALQDHDKTKLLRRISQND